MYKNTNKCYKMSVHFKQYAEKNLYKIVLI